ncbi:MAG TPA: TonB-dependent receptor, partial [Candidatus Baltobacteraceae bacterium]|nr:TonB-dependent receptor [Candidatus Baltobacteraceae bacterium]
MAGATVVARDGFGAVLSRDRSAGDGTFALRLEAPAQTLEVSCIHCRSARVALGGRTNVALIVLRYRALESGVPDSDDISVLPYTKVADVAGLTPYAVPAPDGNNLSDRGLDRGRGLILDDGVPVYDIATGASDLPNVPGRYIRSITTIEPSRAFRYGSYAGGGTFALDQLGAGSLVSGDAGQPSTLALEPRIGIFAPSAGVSSDGTLQRRADFDVVSGFAGGQLRVGAAAAERLSNLAGDDAARNTDLGRIEYATASRRYLTFASLGGGAWRTEEFPTGDTGTRGSTIAFQGRIEEPGPVTLAAGVAAGWQSGTSVLNATASRQLSGYVATQTAYVEARGSGAAGDFFAGLGVAHVTAVQSYESRIANGDLTVVLPSLQLSANLGGGFALRAGASSSLRVPTLLETYAPVLRPPYTGPPNPAFVLERGSLLEGGLSYDSGTRLKVEAIAFHENLDGLGQGRLLGIGGSLVWQVAPLVSVRLWTLRDSPLELGTPNYYLMPAQTLGRQIL